MEILYAIEIHKSNELGLNISVSVDVVFVSVESDMFNPTQTSYCQMLLVNSRVVRLLG